jgi:hypothetical protein
MKVNTIKEHEDGSATVEFEYTPEEHKMLLEYAFINILRDSLKEQNARANETQE